MLIKASLGNNLSGSYDVIVFMKLQAVGRYLGACLKSSLFMYTVCMHYLACVAPFPLISSGAFQAIHIIN